VHFVMRVSHWRTAFPSILIDILVRTNMSLNASLREFCRHITILGKNPDRSHETKNGLSWITTHWIYSRRSTRERNPISCTEVPTTRCFSTCFDQAWLQARAFRNKYSEGSYLSEWKVSGLPCHETSSLRVYSETRKHRIQDGYRCGRIRHG